MVAGGRGHPGGVCLLCWIALIVNLTEPRITQADGPHISADMICEVLTESGRSILLLSETIPQAENSRLSETENVASVHSWRMVLDYE